MKAQKEKVIIAMDFENKRDFLFCYGKVAPVCHWFKIGSVLYTAEGNQLIKFLVAQKKSVFLDLKFYDIPNTVGRACKQVAKLGVKLITVHLSGGSEMIKAALDNVKSESPETKVIGVSVLTSFDESSLKEVGVHHPISNQVNQLVEMGLNNNIDGVVCSAQENTSLRENFGKNFLIVNPGIRLPEEQNDDQKRVVHPQTASASGADYLVIGRSITHSTNPKEKFITLNNYCQ